LTKNLPLKLFEAHEKIIMGGILPYRREDVELALDSMTERDSDGRAYGIPQGSTIENTRPKIESQSGKPKGGNVISREADIDGVDSEGINNNDSGGRNTNPFPSALNIQVRGTQETTAKDAEAVITTRAERTPSWTVVRERRRSRKIRGQPLEGVT
jgi:hypothetical protein